MYKIAFVLLFAAATQSAALGKRLDTTVFAEPSSSSSLKSVSHSDNYRYKLAATASKTTVDKLRTRTLPPASNNRRTERRTTTAAVPKPQRMPAGKGLSTSNAGVGKKAGAPLKSASKDAVRVDVARPARGALKGHTRRALNSNPAASVMFPSGERLPKAKARTRKGQEHYDPTRSGNPPLHTNSDYRFVKLSEHFTTYEFARSGKVQTDISRIDPQLVRCLESIRQDLDMPVYVYSGYRTYWHNLAVYEKKHKKATDSQHIAGKAADVKIDGMTGLEIGKAAINACGPTIGIGIGGNYAHIDVRGVFASWKYKDSNNKQLAELRQYRESYLVARKTRDRKPRRGSPRSVSKTEAGAL